MEKTERGRLSVIIINGNVALPHEKHFQCVDILVKGEKIAAVEGDLSQEMALDDEVIDAEGLFVLPGGIDPHVHFDDPGYTEREDFYHGCCAAASGGITSVIDMPCTSVPPVTEKSSLLKKLEIVEKKAVVDFGLFGGVSAQSFEEGFPRFMEELSETVLGFKTYFISGMAAFGRLNHYQFRKVLERAKALELPLLLHAEDYDYVTGATAALEKERGTPLRYYRSRPETAETLAVLCARQLAEETGADLHIVHVGTAEAADIKGTRITKETAPHYLEFDVSDFERIGAPLKCTPPVKEPENKNRLWQLLSEGSIDFVASDHAPCTSREKKTGSIWSAYSGIPGCETLVPYVFSEGYMKGRLSLKRFVEVISEDAARRYGLFSRKGSIEVGKDADFVLIDPKKSWKIRGKKFYSKGKITPFEGMELSGKIAKTVLRGKIIYTWEKGILADAGYGILMKRI